MWLYTFFISYRQGSISEGHWTLANKDGSIVILVSTEQCVPLKRCFNLTLYSLFCPPWFYCKWLNGLLMYCQHAINYEPLSLRLGRRGTLLPRSVISGKGGSRFSVPAASWLWFRMCGQRQTVPLQIQSNRKEQRPKQEKPGSLCVHSQGVLGSLGVMTPVSGLARLDLNGTQETSAHIQNKFPIPSDRITLWTVPSRCTGSSLQALRTEVNQNKKHSFWSLCFGNNSVCNFNAVDCGHQEPKDVFCGRSACWNAVQPRAVIFHSGSHEPFMDWEIHLVRGASSFAQMK